MNSNSVRSKRILSLDVFRGLTMVLMILVNSQGTRTPYPLLEHATWNGCTLADLVFPFFLFIVGLTSVISLSQHKACQHDNKTALYISILRRSIILFILGLILNAIPYHFNPSTLRFYGILQRIAVCYLICSIVYLNTRVTMQCFLYFGLLLAYWFVMTIIPVPGFGANQLTEDGNWVAYVDQMFFSMVHLFGKTYDPEGFLSTIPAIASTLSGVLTGHLLMSQLSAPRKSVLMIGTGVVLLVLGWLWGFSFPINKNIWTSSFVLLTSGFALIVYSLCFIVVDVLGYVKWALPLKMFGMNAIFIFIFHVILLKIQSMFSLTLKNGTTDNLRIAITDYLFGGYSTQNAGLLYALSFLFLNFLVVAILYYRKIFIRI